MNRRKFMKASMALSAVSGMTAPRCLRSPWADDGIADGTAVRFDFDVLKESRGAGQTALGRRARLPATANLTPQAYNEIQYDANHSLWNNIADRELDVQFFHVGMGFKRRIRMFSVDAASREAREIHFRPELFNYHNANVDTQQLVGKPTSALPVSAPLKPELARRDIVSFLGASYFRAVDETYQYGLSARGVAVNTFSNGGRVSRLHRLLVRDAKAEDTTFVVHCWTGPASPVPTSSPFTAKKNAW